MLNWIGKGFAACESIIHGRALLRRICTEFGIPWQLQWELDWPWWVLWECEMIVYDVHVVLQIYMPVRIWYGQREREIQGGRVLFWLTTTSFDPVCHSNGNHGSACKWSVGTLFLCSFLKGNITRKEEGPACFVSLSASSGLFMKSATESVVLGQTSLSSEDKSASSRIWVCAHFVYGSLFWDEFLGVWTWPLSAIGL